MTHSRALPAAAAAFVLAMLAAPVAHAFTLQDQSSAGGNGGARYVDPDEQFSSNNNGNGQTIHNGNTTFHFGGQSQSFDQRYNSERMFDPLGRPGGPDR